MRTHLRHLGYLLRRKLYFFRYGGLVGVSLWERLTHDAFQFHPALWRIGVVVFHQPSVEDWIQQRAAKILAYTKHSGQRPEDADAALAMAKKERVPFAREEERLSDIYAMHCQHRAPHRWEHWVVRDLAQTRYVEIPERWVRAMVADWCTGARMSGAEPDKVFAQVRKYYVVNREAIRISPANRRFVQELLEGLK